MKICVAMWRVRPAREWSEDHTTVLRTSRPHHKLILILLLLIGIYGCKNKDVIQTANSKQNVILISIDTVRADYLKLYNPSGASTPNLEEFSKSAVLFKNVISQVPYTLPSHCTMLT